jgi:hypothetical protein
MPPRTLVFYTTLFRDGAGETFVPHEVVERVSAAASAPTYGFLDQYIGHGIVGGQVYSLSSHGASCIAPMRSVRGTRFRYLEVALTDMAAPICDVRFTPENGHSSPPSRCQLWANSGHPSFDQFVGERPGNVRFDAQNQFKLVCLFDLSHLCHSGL